MIIIINRLLMVVMEYEFYSEGKYNIGLRKSHIDIRAIALGDILLGQYHIFLRNKIHIPSLPLNNLYIT